jgi:hypothetical protein
MLNVGRAAARRLAPDQTGLGGPGAARRRPKMNLPPEVRGLFGCWSSDAAIGFIGRAAEASA